MQRIFSILMIIALIPASYLFGGDDSSFYTPANVAVMAAVNSAVNSSMQNTQKMMKMQANWNANLKAIERAGNTQPLIIRGNPPGISPYALRATNMNMESMAAASRMSSLRQEESMNLPKSNKDLSLTGTNLNDSSVYTTAPPTISIPQSYFIDSKK